MNIKLSIDIIKSLLLARFRQSLVAAVSVTFSIAMFVTLLGFMNGLNRLLDGLILNRTPHVRLFNEIKPNPSQPINSAPLFSDSYNFIQSIKPAVGRMAITNSLAIIQSLKQDDRVLGIAPKTNAPVLFNAGIIDINGAVSGIDIIAENELFHFNDYIVGGNSMELKTVNNSIVLGKGLADKLLVNLGDIVQVTTAQGDRLSLKVVGFFQSGIQDFDKVQSFASLATTQRLLGKSNDYITDIQIKVKDLNAAPTIAKEYASLYNSSAEDIQTANAQFETGTRVRTIISYAVGITLLIVAGFGIYNILNMMIYEKMDTIAILKATGFAGKDVQRIFIGIALIIGFIGSIFGLILGLGLLVVIDNIPFKISALPSVTTFPVDYNPKYFVIAVAFSLITTYLAGYFPAKKASKVDPVIIIRGK